MNLIRIFSLLFFIVCSSYILSAQCFPDRHTTLLSDHWQSCEKIESPNQDRSVSHWIQLDLGAAHKLYSTQFWNCNVYNQAYTGASNISVDLSMNGIDWIEWGNFDLPRANGSSYYEGVEGPNLDGAQAQYVLFTIESTFGNNDCACLAEMLVETETIVSTSIAELQMTNFQLFPNPAMDWIEIQYSSDTNEKKYDVHILDALGQETIVYNKQPLSAFNNQKIDISSFPSGQYVLRISTNESHITQPFIIIKDQD